MATNTLATLTVENKKFYDRNLIERMLPELHLYKDAQKRKLPKHEGTQISFRKYNSLDVPGASLTEGVTPAGTDLNISEITATVKQEGDYIVMSDMLNLAGIDNNIVEATDLLGEQASLTTDTRIRDIITKGTNVRYANKKGSTGELLATDVITGKDVELCVRTLKNKNAKKFADGYYHAIISPSQAYDIMQDPKWIDASKYARPEQLLDGEIGKLGGVRFMESTNVLVKTDGSASAPVHRALIYGKDAYGVVDLEKGAGKPEVIVKQAGSSGVADALNQRSSVGWKACFTATIIDQDRIVRLETGVTE